VNAATLVQKPWNYCNVLRDDGMSYGDYVEQLTYLLFLKMADVRAQPPYSQASIVPGAYSYAMVLHTHQANPHVHLAGRAEGRDGRRLKACCESRSMRVARQSRFRRSMNAGLRKTFSRPILCSRRTPMSTSVLR
jgi:HsdM N-terminal domain